MSAGTFLVVALLLLAEALTAGLNHDEEQYVAAAYLTTQLAPYQDFIYLQTPYYPYVLGFLFSFIDGNYFLAARLLSWTLALGAVGIVLALAVRITRQVPAALAIAALFAASSTMLPAFGSSRNDIMPCFFALLGICLVYLGQEQDRGRALRHFLGGVALAIAVGAKISYAFVPLVTALYVLLTRRGRPWREHLGAAALPLLAGGLLGAAPLVYSAAVAWEQFLYGNLLFHLEGTVAWHTRTGNTDLFARSQQIRELVLQMRKDTTLAALIFMAFVVFAARAGRRLGLLFGELAQNHGLLFLALFVVAVPFCLMPRPAYVQYFQPLVPFLMLSTACVYAAAARIVPDIRTLVLMAATVVSVAPTAGDLGRRALQLAAPDSWTVSKVHDASVEVRTALERVNASGKVLTLSPIRALDSGLRIYPEFATGPFFYRTADLLPADRAAALKGLSSEDLDRLFAEDPPAAVLAGWEGALDRPLIARARAHGFVPVDGRFDGGVLLVRPGRRDATLENVVFASNRSSTP